MKNSRKIFLSLRLLLLSSLSPFLLSEGFIPDPPSLNATSYILIDAVTKKVLAEKDSNQKIEPASLTKIMTGYVVADQISQGFVNLDDEVYISINCWKKGGSRMYIKEGTRVLLSDLIKGMVVSSGNDASCAIAEHIAGTEEKFVQLMMKYVSKMGLSNTNLVNPHGWPNDNHYSSAADLANLSRKLISDFPQHYSIYKEKWFTYNEIRQRNRNSLLWQDDSIDGLKTGHTEKAGYCLVSSGMKNGTRLIAVTLNSNSERTRLTDNRRLLDYGFRYFVTKRVIGKNELLKEEKVWGGLAEQVNLISSKDIYLTLSPRDFNKIETYIYIDEHLQAPLIQGEAVGKVSLQIDGNELARENLITSQEVLAQGFLGRAWSNLKLLVYSFLMEDS